MSLQSRLQRSARRAVAPLPDRLRGGALGGAAVGGGLLAVGLARGALALVAALLFGARFAGGGLADFAWTAAGYVAGFAAAGALVGALWPLRRSALGAYALGYLGAGVVSAAIAGAEMGAEAARDPAAFAITVGVMTVVFGSIAGHAFRRMR